MDRLLNTTRTGPLHLAKPEFAKMVVDAICYPQRERQFSLHNFVVMANHVHLLITPLVDVLKVTHSLKRFTAKEGNRMLDVLEQPF